MGLSKITIRKNNVKVSLSAKGETLDQLCEKALNVFDAVYDRESPMKTGKKTVSQSSKEKSEPKEQEWTTRTTNERLPNIVNLNDFKLEKAETETTNMRCPHCGQSFCAVTCGMLMVKDIKKPERGFNCIKEINDDSDFEDILFHEDTMDIRDYYDDMVKAAALGDDDDDFVVDENAMVVCPICGNSDRTKQWMLAWREKEKFFGLNDICDLCGGEVEHVIEPEGPHGKCIKCGMEYEKKE